MRVQPDSVLRIWKGLLKRARGAQHQTYSPDLNHTLRPYVPQRVSAVAAAQPNAIAIRAGSACLTYGALNARANQLARYLFQSGVASETPVGICLPRSFDQIVAILAVLKAGGAFLLLDPAWPIERIRQFLDDAQSPVLVTMPDTAETLSGADRIFVCQGRDSELLAQFDPHDIAAEYRQQHLAYIIYTSGSTGEPKGVEITHSNLANLIDWHHEAFQVNIADCASHLAGLGFDAAVWEVWPYLCAGASVSLVPETARTSPELLQRWLIDQRISIAFVPTVLAEPMITVEWPADTRLRYLLTGAETLHSYPPLTAPYTLVNNYGPTECTVVATSGAIQMQLDSDALPPIGWPIANVQIYLLSPAGAPVSVGETGEIYIGGAGVGRGYRNRPQLTADRFVPDTFSPVPGGRLYRTGDLGCLLPDGQIAFKGRIDDQVNIRGHRIEPEEITRVLRRHPLVAASAVLARDNGVGDKQLVAYILPAGGGEPSAEDLRAFLAELLPDYMVPNYFVHLNSLPVTASGKLDKSALPEPTPENALSQVRYRGAQTPAEERLGSIVAEVLGVPRIGSDDNFFLMGGHSLLATQVVLRARDAFGVDVTLFHIFEAKTVAKLATTIERLLIERLDAMSEEEAQRCLAV